MKLFKKCNIKFVFRTIFAWFMRPYVSCMNRKNKIEDIHNNSYCSSSPKNSSSSSGISCRKKKNNLNNCIDMQDKSNANYFMISSGSALGDLNIQELSQSPDKKSVAPETPRPHSRAGLSSTDTAASGKKDGLDPAVSKRFFH